MPINNREVKIIKVPLSDKERKPDYPKSFPKMPRMYLELIENKNKVKQDLINKEYIPNPNLQDDRKEVEQTKDRDKDRDKDRNDRDKDRNDRDKDRNDRDKDRNDRDKDRNDRDRKDRHKSNDSDSISVDSDKPAENDAISEKIDSRSRSHSDVHSNLGSDTDTRSDAQSDAQSDASSDTQSDAGRDNRNHNRSNHSDTDSDVHRSKSDTDSDAISDRLKELLNDRTTSSKSKSVGSDKYSHKTKSAQPKNSHYTPYDKFKQQTSEEPKASPPTLAELEAKGHYQSQPELRNINHITKNEYEEEDKKRELIFKFGVLKKSYPLAAQTIPEWTIHSDHREMQKSYDDTVKRLSLDSTVENYKSYLIGGFSLVEFVFGNFLGFDMQGFTQQQIINMHSYEKLLIELGEKSYVPTGSKWPVELRLLFIIIMNAGFFIVSKMILRRTGANIMNMVNSMHQGATAQTARPKRRMRGPNINVEDIPDVSSTA